MLFFKNNKSNVYLDFRFLQDNREDLYRLFDDQVVFNSIPTTLFN